MLTVSISSGETATTAQESASRSITPRKASRAVWYKHIGPYAWRRDFLLDFASGGQTPLEIAESLEMLRVLERGYTIRCVPAPRDTIEVDTPDDLGKLEAFLAARPGGVSASDGARP